MRVSSPLVPEIPHEHPDCVGVWIPSEFHICCTECGATHPANVDTLTAAVTENASTVILVKAARQGQALIDTDMGNWEDGNH